MRREGDFYYDSGYEISDQVYFFDALHAADAGLSVSFYPFDRNKSLGVLEKLSAKRLCWLGISIFVVSVLPISPDDFSKTDIAGMMFVYCLLIFSGGMEFLYCRCQETMEDTEEEVSAAREKEKIDRQHRKKTNYFLGK